jgi:hypothetical protein
MTAVSGARPADPALEALVGALDAAAGPLGYELDWTARRLLADKPEAVGTLAVHAVRPPLRRSADGSILDEWRKAPYAPSADAALERMRRVEALSSHALVGDAALAAPLARALRALPDATHPDLLVGPTAAIETSGAWVFVACRDEEAVTSAFAEARAASARLRFVDELAEVSNEEVAAGSTIHHAGTSEDGLHVAALGSGRFLQERTARGEPADRRVASASGTAWLRPSGLRESPRVAAWFARRRLARLSTLRAAAEITPAARAATEAGWRWWPELLDCIAGLVAVGEWGGVADAKLGPLPAVVWNQSSPWLTVGATKLLPLGHYPFRGRELHADGDRRIWGLPWVDAPEVVPLASSPESLFEKLALEDGMRLHPFGTLPTVQVHARAGKDFWKRLPATRDEAASDEVSEHYLADGLWVERGVLPGHEYVRLHLVPDELFVAIASRLARTTSGARLIVGAYAERGWERLRLLQDAGVDAVAE